MPFRITAAHLWPLKRFLGPEGRLDFRRDVDSAAPPLSQGLADDAFAMAIPVTLSGVDEIDALLEGVEERADGVGVVDLAPRACELPSAKANFADLPAGARKRAVLHDRFLPRALHGLGLGIGRFARRHRAEFFDRPAHALLAQEQQCLRLDRVEAFARLLRERVFAQRGLARSIQAIVNGACV